MKPYYASDKATLYNGDALTTLRELSPGSVNCCITSPPYWGLRDYKADGQVGLERTPELFVEKLVAIFAAVRGAMADDGTLWLNLGDCYNAYNAGAGPSSKLSRGSQTTERPKLESGFGRRCLSLKPKDLIGVPWMVAFALRADGWYLRSSIIWAKPNGMPGSQDDRPTSSYETVFLLSKSRRYYSDFDAIKTPPRESSLIRTAQDVQAQAGSHRANGGAKTNGTMKAVGVRTNKQAGHGRRHAGFNERWDEAERVEQESKPAMIRDVWFVSPATCDDAHFAVMPDEIARRCVLAGCPWGGAVIDPFAGSGTTLKAALSLGRKAIGVELNRDYCKIIRKRISGVTPPMFDANGVA